MSMTVGEHSNLLKGALQTAPKGLKSLNNANALVAAKELYELGEVTKEAYIGFLKSVMLDSGYNC